MSRLRFESEACSLLRLRGVGSRLLRSVHPSKHLASCFHPASLPSFAIGYATVPSSRTGEHGVQTIATPEPNSHTNLWDVEQSLFVRPSSYPYRVGRGRVHIILGTPAHHGQSRTGAELLSCSTCTSRRMVPAGYDAALNAYSILDSSWLGYGIRKDGRIRSTQYPYQRV